MDGPSTASSGWSCSPNSGIRNPLPTARGSPSPASTPCSARKTIHRTRTSPATWSGPSGPVPIAPPSTSTSKSSSSIRRHLKRRPRPDRTSPSRSRRLRQTDWFPVALAALLAFLALAAISHTLVTGTRRRRRELAILKTLGFKRRQVRWAVASQATTLAVAGLVLGIPIGLLVGTTIWRSVANGVGVVNSPEDSPRASRRPRRVRGPRGQRRRLFPRTRGRACQRNARAPVRIAPDAVRA